MTIMYIANIVAIQVPGTRFLMWIFLLWINCTFLNLMQTGYERSCAVEFGFGKEGHCVYGDLSYTLSSDNGNTNNSHIISVEVPIVLMKNDVLCFAITAHDDRDSARVERMLTINSGRFKK